MHEATVGDRYLLCSDGLSGVVTEETLHQALSSVRDPDKAALQLVELALKGGGPDNITCIVADVVDLQTMAVPPSQAPVMAGAASTGAPQVKSVARPNSPAARAVRLRKTAPQPAVPSHAGGEDWPGGDQGAVTGRFQHPDVAADPPATVPRGSHRAGSRIDDDDDDFGARGTRRRWPIVTTLLVVLVLALAGGGFASWQWVQGKYYIGADNNDVAIYHGINSSIFGVSLSSLQRNTGLPVARLSVPDQGAVRATVSYDSLTAAQQGFNQVQSQVNSCEQQWNDLVDWKSEDNAYLAKLKAYNSAKAHAKPGNHVGAPPTAPAPQPPTPGRHGLRRLDGLRDPGRATAHGSTGDDANADAFHHQACHCYLVRGQAERQADPDAVGQQEGLAAHEPYHAVSGARAPSRFLNLDGTPSCPCSCSPTAWSRSPSSMSGSRSRASIFRTSLRTSLCSS